MKPKDLTVLIVVIAIVIMMVIPLPTLLLDFLLITNISVALLILLVTMNMKDSLQFSVFPSLLLLTTLFRLSLNVSTTRSILSRGDGGEVIATFGSFVVQGNAVVGMIIFLILIVIQFIVITKGAERVAEVAARFTLDAMPGKQMSIDADLNAGMISEKQAYERRRKIEREANFYGAMDGASKFVKGDAIASIIIFLINIIGGLIIGVTMQGRPFSEAVQHYTLLSIGDGLVSQIPALLISTATGIVVTRAVSENNLSSDVLGQLLSFPRMLYIVAGTIGLLGLFTPIGLWRTLPMAALLAFGGFRLSRIARELETTEEIPIEQAEEQDFRNPEHAFHLLQVDPIEFEFGYGLIPLADVQQGGDLLDRVVMIRRQLAVEMGFVVPMIRIRDNIQLDPNQYIIKIKGNPVASGSLYLDMFLAMGSSEDDGGIRGIKTREPAFGLPALWIDETEKERAEMAGFTVVDPPSVVATHLTEIIKHHAYELLGRQETQAMINFVKEQHAALVEELTPQKLSVGEIQKVLSKLLKEKVSIRNLAQIFETLADHAVYTKDADLLAEYVRQSLARQITRQYVREDNELQVITVGPGLEKVLKEHIQETEQGSYLALDPMTTQTVFQNIQKEIGRVSAMGIQAVFLTAPSVRMFLRQLVERVAPQAAVLSYNELESDVAIQSVGVVNI